MFSTIQSALQGINSNKLSMTKHANRISTAGQPISSNSDKNISLPEEIVGLMQSQRGIEAEAAVIRTADEMLGTLIDTFA